MSNAPWSIESLGEDYSYIKNAVSGLCLGVQGVDDHTAGAGVEVYHCNPGNGIVDPIVKTDL